MSISRLRAAIVGLALAGLCLPTTGWADATALPAPQIADVALRDGGVLVGQMVNGQNAPQSGVRVSLQDVQNREVAATVTDRQGSFAISGVRGGVYQVVTPQGRQVYRLWSPGIAPPSAQQGILLVAPGETVRGGLGDGCIRNFVSNPLVIGAAIATAVAVPVVVIATNRSPSSP
ncbi:MAG: carboxypeptidase-like regulatory domain-containing protein [Planctomycetota bacterium]